MSSLPIDVPAPAPPADAARLVETVHGRALLALRLALRADRLTPPERELLADHLFAIEAAAEDLAAMLGTTAAPSGDAGAVHP